MRVLPVKQGRQWSEDLSEELWVVRAGEKAKYVAEFEAHSYIAISFVEIAGDDLNLTDEESLRQRSSTPAERTYVGQLIAFAYKLQMGDLVIVPRLTKPHRDYLVARITGPYQYVSNAPASGNHRRPVEWLGTFTRESISEAAANTLGAILTMFRPTAVEPELRGLLTALAPLSANQTTHPAAVSVSTKPPSQEAAVTTVAVAPTPRPLTESVSGNCCDW